MTRGKFCDCYFDQMLLIMITYKIKKIYLLFKLQIEQKLARLQFSTTIVKNIQDVFESEMNKGIHQQPSSLQMENTYVPELLDGTGC